MKGQRYGAGALLALAALFLALLIISRSRREDTSKIFLGREEKNRIPAAASAPLHKRHHERWVRQSSSSSSLPAEEIVAQKVTQFARSRRELARKLAERHGVNMNLEVERFFDAIESGDWSRIEETFKIINGGDTSAGHASSRKPEVTKMWPAIIDAFGAAEQAHLWPAQSLLDYGNSILDSLRPGMVYVGGTDSSRWIPALINGADENERFMLITQNGLADSSYLDYIRLQYDGRMNNVTEAEANQVFESYISDARQRLQHDTDFPSEPKQLRPNEDVKIVDGKVQVSGQVAVMAINERLLKMILDKNPEMSFAIGESFPLEGTYAAAAPLGPIQELRASEQNAFTPERAAESLQTWRETAQRIQTDPESARSDEALKTYSHDAAAAGNLLDAHNYLAEAEETYRLSRELWPENPETAARIADLLKRTNRAAEAESLLQDFRRQYPARIKDLERSMGYSRVADEPVLLRSDDFKRTEGP